MNNISITDQIALNSIYFQQQFQVFNYPWSPVWFALSYYATEKTSHSASADTISCPPKDGPWSNKFQTGHGNVTIFSKPEVFFPGEKN